MENRARATDYRRRESENISQDNMVDMAKSSHGSKPINISLGISIAMATILMSTRMYEGNWALNGIDTISQTFHIGPDENIALEAPPDQISHE